MTGLLDRTVGTTQVLGSLTCVWERMFLILDDLQTIAQFALGVWMCLLVVIQFAKESVQTYNVTRRWRLNHYQTLLIWEGLIYFMVYVSSLFSFSARRQL